MKKHCNRFISMFLCLSVTMSCGLFSMSAIATTSTATTTNSSLGLEVATDGMILLKNKNKALPLVNNTVKTSNVAIFGNTQINTLYRGLSASGPVPVSPVNIAQGLINNTNINVYDPLYKAYNSYSGIETNTEMAISKDMMASAADFADTAIITIGRQSAEGTDRTATKGDYYLSTSEEELISQVTAAGFKNVVVVLNICGVMDSSWFVNNSDIDSVLLSWLPGEEAGTAIAMLLTGEINPSGKLTDTFAKDWPDYPSSDNFSNDNDVTYNEDIYVGYRYFETFDPTYSTVNYEFGYGLSYTTFSIDDVDITVADNIVTMTAKVTNTGHVAGQEVVQLYYSAPQGLLGKPAKELGAFVKTDILRSGESQIVTASFDVKDMASYDDTGKVLESAYILEAGDYNFYVGNSVKNAGKNGIRDTYTIAKTITVEQLTEQLAPTELNKRLLADGTYENLTVIDKATSALSQNYSILTDESIVVGDDTLIEAESGTRTGVLGLENFDGGVCVNNMGTKGDTLTFSINCASAGDYELYLNVTTPDLRENPVNIYVNDVVQARTINYYPDTDGWATFMATEPAYISLNEGENTLKLEIAKDAQYANLDSIRLVKHELVNTVSTVAQEGTTKIEAETFASVTNGARTEGYTADGTQGILLAYMDAGYDVTYNLNVEKAGNYNLILSSANGLTTTEDAISVLVNGLSTGSAIDLPATDGWYNFNDTPAVEVTLPKGNCTLTIHCNNTFGNLDSFKLSFLNDVTQTISLLDVYNDASLMDNFISQLSDEQLIGITVGPIATHLTKYGVLPFGYNDGSCGVNSTGNYLWPCSTLVASTWNVNLVERMGVALGDECISNSLDLVLGPGINIHRNPLCPRNFEYYSEDPILTAEIGIAMVNGIQSTGEGVTVKHFACNNKDDNRNQSNSIVSERALREIYLKAFEKIVKEAKPYAIMTSYNFINSTETSENTDLLTNIARGEWGYKGLFMTDWGNDSNLVNEILAGNNIKMPEADTTKLTTALSNGTITREILEKNAAYIFNLAMKTTTFYNTYILSEASKNRTVKKSEINKISAAYYDSEDVGDVQSELCGDEGKGLSLAYIDSGDTVSYQIDVKDSDDYAFYTRYAVNAGTGQITIYIDDTEAFTYTLNSTEGWQNWVTSGATMISLTQGTHKLSFKASGNGFNLNWFMLIPTEINTTINDLKQQFSTGITNLTVSLTDEFKVKLAELQDIHDRLVTMGVSEDIIDPNSSLSAAQNAYKILVYAEYVDFDDPVTYTLGDINEDENITAADALLALQYSVDKITLEDNQLSAADVNGDSKITAADALCILQYSVNKIFKWPIEE